MVTFCEFVVFTLLSASGVSLADLPDPEASTTCNATRPLGVTHTPIYCTRTQGFACEVFEVKFRFPKAHITVWNSYGCGCNYTLYRSTHWTAQKRRNGPRHWTADTFVSETAPVPGSVDSSGDYITKTWDGMDYRYGAELDVPYSTVIKNLITGDQPWTFSTITRTGARIWKAGRQVYEILTKDSRVLIMQAFSMQIDETLTNDEGLLNLLRRPLPKTGKPMNLPSGWAYRCRVLAKDLVIKSNGTATIMQDEFYNNYMEETVQAEYSEKACVPETEEWRKAYCGATLAAVLV